VSAEYLGTMPRLYGAPSYTPPPRPGIQPQRPFDPDDLPLACSQVEDVVAAHDEPLLEQANDAFRESEDWFLRPSGSPFGPRAAVSDRW
jgi:hypothetical protein